MQRPRGALRSRASQPSQCRRGALPKKVTSITAVRWVSLVGLQIWQGRARKSHAHGSASMIGCWWFYSTMVVVARYAPQDPLRTPPASPPLPQSKLE